MKEHQNRIFDKGSYDDILKKAKKRSIRRTVIISFTITFIAFLLLATFLFFAYQNMNNSMEDYSELRLTESKIQGANINHDKITISYGIESAITQEQYIKNIAGLPFTWYNEQTLYKIYDAPTTIMDSSITSINGIHYYRNGQRVINFRYPTAGAANDDRDLLKNLPANSKVEVALSFKKAMKVEELADYFPNAQWVWVADPELEDRIAEELRSVTDTEERKRMGYVIGDYAYGFKMEKDVNKSSGNFITSLKKLEKQHHQTAISILSKTTNPDDLEISGVVLTGTASELSSLNHMHLIQFVSVGVIIPY
ncbi:Sigma factor regulator C-terminal [Bhargavaea beijingensis]|uniref:Sigma factor regulator C-terminal n=1 Tax=Bhargavaea beijingensis TaxID=426756 RepID=A0A1G6XZJ8_9BACL|nr:anti sigma factor C-terminal domain-containing protein [Bhargavaea beijingensis]SDD83113.1 Sigma factor regulator C-terminal [Bhargavaea beijingensis]